MSVNFILHQDRVFAVLEAIVVTGATRPPQILYLKSLIKASAFVLISGMAMIVTIGLPNTAKYMRLIKTQLACRSAMMAGGGVFAKAMRITVITGIQTTT